MGGFRFTLALLALALTTVHAAPLPPLNASTYAALRSLVATTFNLSASYGTSCVSCPAGDTVGGLVRLAFHDAAGGGGPAGVGGANGCLDLSTPLNNDLSGFVDALSWSLGNSSYSGLISLADYIVLAATLAVELSSTMSPTPLLALFNAQFNPLNASARPLILPFVTGRVDDPSCNGVDAQYLPTTSFLWANITALFGTRLGMTPPEIIAIMGAHSVGRMKSPIAVGNISGGWVQTQSSLSNTYYSVLLNGAQGWFGTSNVNGTLTPTGGGAGISDAWTMRTPLITGTGGNSQVNIFTLRTDAELGVNTTSLFDSGRGPLAINSCGSFGLDMMPAAVGGLGPGSLTAKQNVSCPRRYANLQTIS